MYFIMKPRPRPWPRRWPSPIVGSYRGGSVVAPAAAIATASITGAAVIAPIASAVGANVTTARQRVRCATKSVALVAATRLRTQATSTATATAGDDFIVPSLSPPRTYRRHHHRDWRGRWHRASGSDATGCAAARPLHRAHRMRCVVRKRGSRPERLPTQHAPERRGRCGNGGNNRGAPAAEVVSTSLLVCCSAMILKDAPR